MKTANLQIFLCLVLLVCFSCKKDAITPVTHFSKPENNLAVTTVNGKQINSDTIPPANVVNVTTFGAVGDGVHDDTQALQNAINSQNVLLLNKGTYIINKTLTLRSGVKIYGTNGATIQPGTSMSGTLLTQGRYIIINGTRGNQIVNVVFKPSTQAFKLISWATAVIYITNSQYTSITYDQFNFNQPYQATGVEGVWVDGALTTNTLIYKNTCNTVGIEYAESGASYTTAQQNIINNAHSNALAGQGNSLIYCTHNIVAYNAINNAGYNGIVDWGTIDGTLIKGNTISGTGKSPSQGSLGEGIQAVGVNTTVSYNTISDAQAEYIEIASTNKQVDSNKIIDTKLVAEGIVVNTQSPAQANAKSIVATLDHNTITGCHDGIEIIGSYSPSVSIINNTITNPLSTGIEVISKAPVYNKVTISGNTINLTTPDLQSRTAILTYPTLLTTSQIVSIINNTINYSTAANGGAGQETAISPNSNDVIVTGNIVNGNSILSIGGKEVYGINSVFTNLTGASISNNTFTGALVNTSGFQTGPV